jgi:signal transduction histidine kinase
VAGATSFSLSGIASNQADQRAEVRECTVWIRWVSPTLSYAVLVGLSYYVGTRIGFALTPTTRPTSCFWPPNATLLAAFLLSPARMWWAFLLAVFPAHLYAQVHAGVPAWTAVGWFISNTAEALIGAFLITRFSKGKSVFDSARGVLIFLVFGVVFAPLASSFLDAAVVVGTGWANGYWHVGATRFFTNTLAELTLVPTIVVWGSHGASWIQKATLARYLEATLLGCGIVATSALVFGWEPVSPGNVPALMYVPLPFLLWGAVRFGSGGLSLSLLSMALISIWNAMQGRGPFISKSMAENVLSLQVLLCMVAVPLLFLAALMVERRRTEESLRKTSARLIDAQEEERHRIARELHDDLEQKLALVTLGLGGLKEKCEAGLKPGVTELLNQLSAISTTTHEISHGLHPSQLEYLGLGAAAKKLCKDVGQGTSLSIQLTAGELPKRLLPAISLCLYRVIQEALHNIVKHSRASKAEIELVNDGGRISLRIVDNGIGFTPGEEPTTGLGLTSMRERVRSVGGSIEITSSLRRGTRIEVWVPVREVTSIRSSP